VKVGMFEGAPSTLLTRFAEELRRAGALLLLTSRIPGPDKSTGQVGIEMQNRRTASLS
jgi:hypothetical protein